MNLVDKDAIVEMLGISGLQPLYGDGTIYNELTWLMSPMDMLASYLAMVERYALHVVMNLT